MALAGGAIVVAGLVIGGLGERPSAAELGAGAKPSRLTTVSSNRYEYWRVGLAAFADHPSAASAPGGFRVRWLQERKVREAVRDVHSLELEQLVELGLVGLLALAAFLAGVLLAARTALRRDPAAAAGAAAAALVWLLHASIDWDWQLPAVTLPALALAGSARGDQRALSGSSRRRAANARVARRRVVARQHREDRPRRRGCRARAGRRPRSRQRPLGLPPGARQQGEVHVRRGVGVEQPRRLQVVLRPRQPGGRAPGPQRRRAVLLEAPVAQHERQPGEHEHGDGRDGDPGRRHSSSAIRGASRLNTQTAETQTSAKTATAGSSRA